MKKAELAKGTFYLYFKDKYEVRDYLIRKKAARIIEEAQLALEKTDINDFEERVIFIVDNILNQLNKNKVLISFISKNLSWGIFTNAIMNISLDETLSVKEFMKKLFSETNKKFRNPEIFGFMILELVNSTAHNVILYKQPVELPELKDELYPLIRQMIHSFEIVEE